MSLPLVHHRDYVAPLAADHRFPMNKYGLLLAELKSRGLVRDGWLFEPEEAPRQWLTMAHAPDYVDRVLDGDLDRDAQRRIGLEMSPAMVRRSRLSCAGTVLAARLALVHGVACQTAGGSHHAHPGFGAGYCVFNDVGVAAWVMRAEGLVRHILVLDLDVHQGDGTAAIFQGETDVFTFSMHAEKNFPVRKMSSDLDVDLEDGLADDAYLSTLQQYLPELLDRHQPDLIFYNAGVDPHKADRLGRLALSEVGLMARDRLVIQSARHRGIPIVTVVGGGYGADKGWIARLHANVVSAAHLDIDRKEP